MATPVEKIAKLEAEIEELKSKRKSTTNEELQIAITNEITAIRNQIIQQQGKIHKHLFSLSACLLPRLTNSFVIPSCSHLHYSELPFYHSPILRQPARPKFDWFMLLVMLLIELRENKDDWAKTFIEEDNRNVSEARVRAEAQRVIENTIYGRDLIAIIEEIMGAYTSDEV